MTSFHLLHKARFTYFIDNIHYNSTYFQGSKYDNVEAETLLRPFEVETVECGRLPLLISVD